jgi:hypothetical protein
MPYHGEKPIIAPKQSQIMFLGAELHSTHRIVWFRGCTYCNKCGVFSKDRVGGKFRRECLLKPRDIQGCARLKNMKAGIYPYPPGEWPDPAVHYRPYNIVYQKQEDNSVEIANILNRISTNPQPQEMWEGNDGEPEVDIVTALARIIEGEGFGEHLPNIGLSPSRAGSDVEPDIDIESELTRMVEEGLGDDHPPSPPSTTADQDGSVVNAKVDIETELTRMIEEGLGEDLCWGEDDLPPGPPNTTEDQEGSEVKAQVDIETELTRMIEEGLGEDLCWGEDDLPSIPSAPEQVQKAGNGENSTTDTGEGEITAPSEPSQSVGPITDVEPIIDIETDLARLIEVGIDTSDEEATSGSD